MVSVDDRETYRRARRALSGGAPGEALKHLFTLVDRAHIHEDELARYLISLRDVYLELDRPRAAATICLFLGDTDSARALSAEHPVDLARCARVEGDPAEAARHLEAAGLHGQAAIQLEEASNDRSARVLWERLGDESRLRDNPYIAGLVYFNLGRACRRLGDMGAARRATVRAMHLLEAAADAFETQGFRERAFDCYQVLLTIGKAGSFENLAEGYLNCIRILAEDNLKYYVLQYYEDFQEMAIERGELHAAATLYREAADYARRQRMPYARHYQKRAAETWVSAAEQAESRSAQLAENAYAAAVEVFNELGLYARVRETYRRLAHLPLSERRKERYFGLSERLAQMRDEEAPIATFPDYLRMDTAYPEIWRLDVIEWEQAGDAAETMAEVIHDPKWPDFTRRRALVCRLAQLGHESDRLSEHALSRLARYLGRVEIYAALAPLEAMYEHESPKVRAACLRAVRQLFFKRSFGLVMRGLSDPVAMVRREAVAAVGAFHFGHAFDPLLRIYREASDPDVRRSALTSIGKIPSVEAVELLIEVLGHGDRAEREVAQQLLVRADHGDVQGLLARARQEQSGRVKAQLDKTLRLRGAR